MFNNEFTESRKNKASRMNEAGLQTHPAATEKRSVTNAEFLSKHDSVSVERADNAHLMETVIGRAKLVRKQGKSGFIKIQDASGMLQIFVSANDMGDNFEVFKSMLDIGDIVKVKGYPFFTKAGELTVFGLEMEILTKSLLPLPEKFHGLEDKETRYRKRYLDMIMNPDVTNVFQKRAKIISMVRRYMEDQEFMEVETPVLNPIPGGANARPFVTFHNALDAERYLRIAPELYLKRLVVGGMEKVFEIGKNFRNEGVDATHNPEFTSIEFYAAHHNYKELMDMIEEMVVSINETLGNNSVIDYGDIQIDLASWTQIPFRQALSEIGGVPSNILDSKEEIYSYLKSNNIQVKEGLSLGKLWEELFDEYVEEKLVNPTFITEYPTEISPLARRSDNDHTITDRFELFIAGREIANGFNELNDAEDQYNRFKTQVETKGSDDEAMHMDKDFVEALMFGLPPTAGAGLGIDRLVMLLTNQHSIRDVIPFPAMK